MIRLTLCLSAQQKQTLQYAAGLVRSWTALTHLQQQHNKQTNCRLLSSKKMFKPLIAIAQMCATNNKEENMCLVEQCVERAAAGKAQMLFLPECCDFIGENRAETLALSEPLSGATVQQYCKLASDNGLWLSLGGLHESIVCENGEKSDKIYNAHVLIDDCGNIVSVYRKLHLFDVNTAEYKFRESDVVVPGNRILPPLHTPIGSLGLQICYDMRFAEPSLILRKSGAELLAYPSAFAYATGKAHWELLLRARAIETQCFVVAAAQVGQHNKKRRSWGHAMVIDPWGEILADCGAPNELNVAIVELNMPKLQEVRSNMPCFEHRRHEVYSLASYNMGCTEVQQDFNFASHVIDKRTIFFESAHSFAFTNLRCVVKGHVLVSTKRVLPRLNGLTCAEMSDLFNTVCYVQRMLESLYETTSATVTVQDGEKAGQTVPHVHFHVMPRRNGDFKENDQIYVKLDEQKNESADRSLEERIAEAARYREALQRC